MSNEIKITVEAAAGVGKTTVAEMLQKMLQSTGWETTHIEFEKLNGMDERDASYFNRLNSIRERSKITIVEQQAKRSSAKKPKSDDIADYFKLAKKIHDSFGYVEDWKVIPMDDCREMYWMLFDDEVRFAETIQKLINEDAGEYYSHEIYTQRFLPKYVYDNEDCTMISSDTHVDGNKFLCIFDNSKRIYEK